jgi:hypothetical protein
MASSSQLRSAGRAESALQTPEGLFIKRRAGKINMLDQLQLARDFALSVKNRKDRLAGI